MTNKDDMIPLKENIKDSKISSAAPTPEPNIKKSLSELQILKTDKFKLQHQSYSQARELASIKLQMMQQELQQSQTELEMEFRAALDAPLDAKFDWNTLTFIVIPTKE